PPERHPSKVAGPRSVHRCEADRLAALPHAPLHRQQPASGLDTAALHRGDAPLRGRHRHRAALRDDQARTEREDPMKSAGVIGVVAGCAMLTASVLAVHGEVRASAKRLKTGATEDKPKVAIADDAEAPYCTPAFKTVLERTLHACGLVGQDDRRGC